MNPVGAKMGLAAGVAPVDEATKSHPFPPKYLGGAVPVKKLDIL